METTNTHTEQSKTVNVNPQWFSNIVKDDKGDFVPIKMSSYGSMMLTAQSLINIALVSLYKVYEQTDNSDIVDVIKVLELATQLMPIDEAELLDSIKTQL